MTDTDAVATLTTSTARAYDLREGSTRVSNLGQPSRYAI